MNIFHNTVKYLQRICLYFLDPLKDAFQIYFSSNPDERYLFFVETILYDL